MKLLILYGTLTMNTEAVALSIFDALSTNENFETEVKNMLEITDANELEDYDAFIIGTSTWSDGSFPPDAEDFMNLISKNPPSIEGKKTAFFGLGETIYEHYCESIKEIRKYFLEELKVQEVGEMKLIDGYPDDVVLDDAMEWGKGIAEELINN